MATITFTVPAGVVTKLNNIAAAKGFEAAKAMVLDFLKAELTYAATKAASSAVIVAVFVAALVAATIA